MSLVTDEGSHSVAETFDLVLIDLASVFGKIINAEKVFRRRGQDLVYVAVCTPSSILQKPSNVHTVILYTYATVGYTYHVLHVC